VRDNRWSFGYYDDDRFAGGGSCERQRLTGPRFVVRKTMFYRGGPFQQRAVELHF